MNINAPKYVKEKLSFEREAQIQGVEIIGYHTENGVLNAPHFVEKILKDHKNVIFSGSSASHQNEAE